MTCAVSDGPSGARSNLARLHDSLAPISVMSSSVTTTLTLAAQPINLPGLLHRDCHRGFRGESQCDHKLRQNQCAGGASGSSRFHAE